MMISARLSAKRWIQRVRTRQALALARAYLALIKSATEPYLPYRLFNAVIDTRLRLPRRLVQWLSPDVSIEQSEIYVKQLLLTAVRVGVIQNLILHSAHPERARVYPLPHCWRGALATQGIAVKGLASFFGLLRLEVAFWRGTIALRRQLLWQASASFAGSDDPFVVVSGAPYAAAKHKLRAGGFTYFDWLAAQTGLVNSDDRFLVVMPTGSDVRFLERRMQSVEFYLPRLAERARRRFARRSFIIVLKALALSLAGQWWAPVLAAGVLESLYFKNVVNPPRRYIFTIAGSAQLRPLWTYIAEQEGIESHLVYYATNIDPIPGRYPMSYFPGMQLQSWSHYVAFNDNQASRLSDCVVGAPSIVVRGPIDFSDEPDVDVALPRRTILVLDTPVRRFLFAPSIGVIDRYITPQYSTVFFADIAKAAAALDATVAWKGKRYGGGRRAVAYERAVDLVSQHCPLIILNENLSPRRIALHCAACVAAPFTSAALLFRASGPPAAYYDALVELPEGLTEKNGLPILAGQARLQEWLSAALIGADPPDRTGQAPT